MLLDPGDRIGDWVVESPLAEGGMGAVYRVHSALSERVQAALKVLKPSSEAEARERFIREAEALSALKHPAIVRVMSFGEDPGRGLPYLAMELALGETLRTRLERGAMSRREVLLALGPLAAALEHAHAAGIFHRDIKPANVVLCDDGAVKLVDFGIAAGSEWATLTTGGHLGTLPYLPPEVFRGETPDPRAMDVYAFGLVLYEALVGERAFPVDAALPAAGIAAAVAGLKIGQGPFDVGPSFPAALRHTLRRATSPEPRDRPSITAVREGLEALRGPDLDRRGRAETAADDGKHETDPGAPSRATDEPGAGTQPFRDETDGTTRVPDPPKPAYNEPPRRTPTRGRRVRTVALALGALALAASVAVFVSTREPSTRVAAVAAAEPPGAGDVWTNPKDELEMVYLPPGSFEMGCTTGDTNCDTRRFPSRAVTVHGFWMGRTEVTASAFRLHAEETGAPLPTPPGFNRGWALAAHPIVNVSWDAARRYCEWAGGRLPSEAEWEYAARGGRTDRYLPWGNEEPVCRTGAANGAWFEGCGAGTVPAASFGANPYGLYDLAGNVWEWCADEWQATHARPKEQDAGTDAGTRRVIRGGSWVNPASFLRVSIRSRWFQERGRDYIGFRCVRDDVPAR